MKKTVWLIFLGLGAAFCFGFTFKTIITGRTAVDDSKKESMENLVQKNRNLNLGVFSLSMNVKDLQISKEFYEKLGFKILSGAMEKSYFRMKNGNSLVGLFHGMFQGNILTFNPGWDENAKNTQTFDNVRDIQKHLLKNNIKLTTATIGNRTGPASIMLNDPDDSVILIDQHRLILPSPEKQKINTAKSIVSYSSCKNKNPPTIYDQRIKLTDIMKNLLSYRIRRSNRCS